MVGSPDEKSPGVVRSRMSKEVARAAGSSRISCYRRLLPVGVLAATKRKAARYRW